MSAERLELSTNGLKGHCSTIELRALLLSTVSAECGRILSCPLSIVNIKLGFVKKGLIPIQAQMVRVDDFLEVCYTLPNNSGIVIHIRCGRGSVGRTSPCQGEGRGFESHRPLFYWKVPIPATWPSGKARVCKTLITGSNPVVASMNEPKRLVFVPGGIPSRYEKAMVCKTLITGSNPRAGRCPVVASSNKPNRLVFVPGGIPSRYDKARVCKTRLRLLYLPGKEHFN